MLEILKSAVRTTAVLLDMLSPRVCFGCGAWRCRHEQSYLCWDCAVNLPYIRTGCCAVCGDAPGGAVTGDWVCSACLAERKLFDSARSAVRFAGLAREMIHCFKYNSGIWLCHDLAELLQGAFNASPARNAADAALGVPLHRLKLRSRTYNQADLLAQALCRRLGIAFLRGCLKRALPTESQTHLTSAQRSANVRGVFVVENPRRVKGLRLLLVDDVMTTGATVNECARALKKAGAAAVHVLTVARG